MERRRLLGVVTASTVAVTGAAVVALNWPAGAGTAAPPPVKPQLHTVALAPADAAAGTVNLPERGTARFSLLGITWIDPKAAPRGAMQVRTRSIATGAWSSWQSLDTDDSQGPDTGAEKRRTARGGSAPLWVGPSDGVAARILSPAGKVRPALPAGLRLDLIDSTGGTTGGQGGGSGQGGGEVLAATADPTAGTSDPTPSDSAPTPTDPTTATTTDPTPTATDSATAPATTTPATVAPGTSTPAPTATSPSPVPPVPLPPYVSRAAWGADESLVTDPPQYAADAKVLFVHHTAGTNTYACSDSPAIVRGILAYHVLSQGWNDIGYNFLVDKCGTLFEGRKGGVDKPVIGAHTYGFNTRSAGIAVLGTYSTVQVPAVTAATIAQVAAYKLGMYGYDPSTTATLTEGVSDGKYPLGTVVTFNRISGHRDGVATECPGAALYAQLPGIRQQATSRFFGLAVKSPAGGVSSGGTYYVRGSVTLTWTVALPASQIARFDLVVDGRTASSVPGTAGTATVPLADGAHNVAVRAVHVSGSTFTSAAAAVYSDTVAPIFTRTPELTFRGGTVSATSAPVTLRWTATDSVKLASVEVTAPATATFGPTVTTWATSAKVGVSRTWRMTAKDAAGNARSAAATRTPTLLSETSATRSGTWTSKSSTSYLGGTSLASSTRNAKLTWTFTGRAAGLIVSRGSASGQVDMYVDGTFAQTVDLRSSTTLYRQLIWARAFTGSTRHTVTLVLRGTTGRPGVTVDGLIYLA